MSNSTIQTLSRADAQKRLSELAGFIGESQLEVIRQNLRGEEWEFFAGKIAELLAVIEQMPRTHQSNDESIAQLHFFIGSGDWWIVELDAGAADDEPEDKNSQCYGLAKLSGYDPEMGYISIPELLKAGAELDLHFTPRGTWEIREEL